MEKMNVAALQCDIVWEDRTANYQKVYRFAKKAADKGADVLVLPEMFATGFSMNRAVTVEKPDGETASFIRALARDFHMNVIAGLVLEGNHGLGRNCALSVDRMGRDVALYTKTHLISILEEDQHHEPGDEPKPFPLGGMNCACFICYDLRFPELFRLIAGKCGLVFVIASWPDARKSHWNILLQARAVENQLYMVGVNRIGSGGGLSFSGGTVIYDPLGKIIAHGGDREGLVVGDVEPAMVTEVRNTMPFLKDRRF